MSSACVPEVCVCYVLAMYPMYQKCVILSGIQVELKFQLLTWPQYSRLLYIQGSGSISLTWTKLYKFSIC